MTEDSIDHLDFAPDLTKVVECQCGRCCKCERPAEFYTKLHAIHECAVPGLTADGGVVLMVCGPCLKPRKAMAEEYVLNAQRISAAHGGTDVICRSCRRSVQVLTNILEVKKLDEL